MMRTISTVKQIQNMNERARFHSVSFRNLLKKMHYAAKCSNAMKAIKRPNSDLTDDANYIQADADMNASYGTRKTLL